MANVVNGNTIYIDTTDDISVASNTNIKVSYITIRAGAADARIELKDNQSSAVNKVDLSVITIGETKLFDYSRKPIVFPNGIDATVTNSAIVTLVVDIR